jgi:hypothetical protein
MDSSRIILRRGEITMGPEDCSRHNYCSASICPLDVDIAKRVWFSDEAICKSTKHSKDIRWIRKQRSIVRRQTTSWLNRPISHKELVDASRKKTVSSDLLERLEIIRQRNQNKCCEVSSPIQPGGIQTHAPMPAPM